jgi:hypothetical protein
MAECAMTLVDRQRIARDTMAFRRFSPRVVGTMESL